MSLLHPLGRHRLDLAEQRNQLEHQLDQAGIELSGIRYDLEQAVAEIRRLQRQRIRDAADKQRLRQAVIDARPRIRVIDTQLVRPYAPVVQLPYTSPADAA
ncbi:hypothetical protein GLX30_30195 [Streptomyces sp. Tu 2975]|uniref:hypothetical protein n=1 Tax=Streptomyces sp. Tu 2975 TaxID=2676871 RepID=UPI00135C344F|nr:hypothetical protein [Streptomyces sp. Tu 2975]QIP87588.1 hypothetical protein GLX30_30195 [Streptomyces sp. Tu 2975]